MKIVNEQTNLKIIQNLSSAHPYHRLRRWFGHKVWQFKTRKLRRQVNAWRYDKLK